MDEPETRSHNSPPLRVPPLSHTFMPLRFHCDFIFIFLHVHSCVYESISFATFTSQHTKKLTHSNHLLLYMNMVNWRDTRIHVSSTLALCQSSSPLLMNFSFTSRLTRSLSLSNRCEIHFYSLWVKWNEISLQNTSMNDNHTHGLFVGRVRRERERAFDESYNWQRCLSCGLYHSCWQENNTLREGKVRQSLKSTFDGQGTRRWMKWHTATHMHTETGEGETGRVTCRRLAYSFRIQWRIKRDWKFTSKWVSKCLQPSSPSHSHISLSPLSRPCLVIVSHSSTAVRFSPPSQRALWTCHRMPLPMVPVTVAADALADSKFALHLIHFAERIFTSGHTHDTFRVLCTGNPSVSSCLLFLRASPSLLWEAASHWHQMHSLSPHVDCVSLSLHSFIGRRKYM